MTQLVLQMDKDRPPHTFQNESASFDITHSHILWFNSIPHVTIINHYQNDTCQDGNLQWKHHLMRFSKKETTQTRSLILAHSSAMRVGETTTPSEMYFRKQWLTILSKAASSASRTRPWKEKLECQYYSTVQGLIIYLCFVVCNQ